MTTAAPDPPKAESQSHPEVQLVPPESSLDDATDPISLGDRAMVYLLVFFFGVFGLVLLFDLISALWKP